MSPKRAWLLALGLCVSLAALAGFISVRIVSQRFEPYIKQQAIEYLKNRFDSDVELAAIHIHLPRNSPVQLLLKRGPSGSARVEGEGLVLRRHGQPDRAALFSIRKFSFAVDLATLFQPARTISLVTLDGVLIRVPPTGADRNHKKVPVSQREQSPSKPAVSIRRVSIRNAVLTILPRQDDRVPLRFDIHQLELEAQPSGPMKYEAALTNAKPPGEITSRGTFGPWVADEPGETRLSGEYTFKNADLGVFSSIAGMLTSSGTFEGALNAIHARGQAAVPDFRLKMAGNPVPLSTRFEVFVDGTNGNTTLQPVHATIGRSQFTTSGAIIKHEGDRRRSIHLNVSMPSGNLHDLLRLAMKNPALVDGQLLLETNIEIPPLENKVRQKLVLDGRFELSEGKFSKSTVQEQIDMLSRRGQGAPTNAQIDEVVSYMGGEFRLENELLTFRSLIFGVPGAHVQLAGNYNLGTDFLDFHGNLRLRAKVSETMSGWKRWALKPVDPFFAKRGAGTFLLIKVDGSSHHAKFGLDHSADRSPRR